MTEIPRAIFTNDEVFTHLYKELVKIHKVPRNTERLLLERKDRYKGKTFTVVSRHFVTLVKPTSSLYVHYDVESHLKTSTQIAVKIVSIGIYDTVGEYERARVLGSSLGIVEQKTNKNRQRED